MRKRNQYQHLRRRAAAQTARLVSPQLPNEPVTTDDILEAWAGAEQQVTDALRELGTYRLHRLYITRPCRIV